jgi:hypothetical protein
VRCLPPWVLLASGAGKTTLTVQLHPRDPVSFLLFSSFSFFSFTSHLNYFSLNALSVVSMSINEVKGLSKPEVPRLDMAHMK